MHKKFIQALKWNSGALFIYKTMLLSHQILLYSCISKTLYGLQSSLFAIIYMLIALSNFGFDDLLIPFFSTFSQSKQQFLSMIQQFAKQIITIFSITVLLYMIIIDYGTGEFLHNVNAHCNKNLIFVICSIFFIENIKKTVMTIMQLAFLNQHIACAQTIMLSCYIGTIWAFYFAYQHITIAMIFVPMLIMSLSELIYYTNCLIQFYQGLPQEPYTTAIPFKVLFKQRIYNYINQITKALYSPNSIILYCAYLFNFQQAATIKFYTNLMALLYTCISKIVGITTGAALSSMNKVPLQEIRNFFTDITKQYFQVLYLLTTIMIVIIIYAWSISSINSITALQISLCFGVNFLEHLSLTYEQLSISQNKAWIITAINLIGLSILIPSTYLLFFSFINQYLFISIFIIVKILSLASMRKITVQYLVS